VANCSPHEAAAAAAVVAAAARLEPFANATGFRPFINSRSLCIAAENHRGFARCAIKVAPRWLETIAPLSVPLAVRARIEAARARFTVIIETTFANEEETETAELARRAGDLETTRYRDFASRSTRSSENGRECTREDVDGESTTTTTTTTDRPTESVSAVRFKGNERNGKEGRYTRPTREYVYYIYVCDICIRMYARVHAIYARRFSVCLPVGLHF